MSAQNLTVGRQRRCIFADSARPAYCQRSSMTRRRRYRHPPQKGEANRPAPGSTLTARNFLLNGVSALSIPSRPPASSQFRLPTSFPSCSLLIRTDSSLQAYHAGEHHPHHASLYFVLRVRHRITGFSYPCESGKLTLPSQFPHCLLPNVVFAGGRASSSH